MGTIMSRRDIGAAIAGAVLAQQAARSAAAQSGATPSPGHEDMPSYWTGKEKIAFLIYPQFTALDMVGPYHMLSALMGAKMHLVAKSVEPVVSDNRLSFNPTDTFETCPRDLDIICVPGGAEGTLAAMQDEATIRFLADVGGKAKFVTSVCTGSLVLGAAGLLDGYRATSHWATRHVLPVFGATPIDQRVVVDRNRMTGGGVTAGIDFGLLLVGRLRDSTYAQTVQLLAEYAPEPPFDAGTPSRAPAEVKGMIDTMFANFVQQAEQVGRVAFARSQRR